MNDINEMPPKCQYCPYWEVCEYPWVCPDMWQQDEEPIQQTCYATDTISRQMAIDAVSDCGICIQRIVDLPYAQPERKTGQWLLRTYMPHNKYCSYCEKDSPYNKRWDFCPSCGADMRGEQDG